MSPPLSSRRSPSAREARFLNWGGLPSFLHLFLPLSLRTFRVGFFSRRIGSLLEPAWVTVLAERSPPFLLQCVLGAFFLPLPLLRPFLSVLLPWPKNNASVTAARHSPWSASFWSALCLLRSFLLFLPFGGPPFRPLWRRFVR